MSWREWVKVHTVLEGLVRENGSSRRNQVLIIASRWKDQERKTFRVKGSLLPRYQAFHRAQWNGWVFVWNLGAIRLWGMGIRNWVVRSEEWDLDDVLKEFRKTGIRVWQFMRMFILEWREPLIFPKAVGDQAGGKCSRKLEAHDQMVQWETLLYYSSF